MKIVGYCDHPNNYFSGSEITEYVYEAEKEECGMRSCKGCIHFVSIQELQDFEGYDKMDFEEEWESWEKDQLANEIEW